MLRVLFLLCLGFSLTAHAQYNGPAVDACRAYAKKELEREGQKPKEVVFERDSALILDRYTRKLGNQFVSSILTGNGAVVLQGSPSAEMSFICLLADDKRPVFFNWLPRTDSAALPQCMRAEELRAKPRPCLELLQRIAEQDLTMIYAQRFQEANERGEKMLAAYRRSNDEWLQYRDAECARRRDYAPRGIAPDDVQLACVVDLTRRRALDMR
ncbi:MAG TPA: lysozyme inhibitor LprI family protein [Burkholderiales bacterium]|nr:lysozyme inhibitor LprI family protein [Burkholderiales bacterium]